MSKKTAANKEKSTDITATKSDHQPYRVRLPGFVRDEDVGLGDVIKHATSYVGISPCGGCDKRAAALNRWMVFSGRRSR